MASQFPHNRRHVRYKFDGVVMFKPQFGENLEGRARDVSEGGAFIISENRLTVGTRMTVYLPLEIERKKKLFIVAAKVVRIGDPVKERPGFGVEFDSKISPATRKVLDAFLAVKTAEQL